jgi:hypothetical protein
MELSLLLFTGGEVIYIKGFGEGSKSKFRKIKPVLDAMATLLLGEDAEEVRKKIEALNGRKIDVDKLMSLARKGSYKIPYKEIKSLDIDKPKSHSAKGIKLTILTRKGKKYDYEIGPLNLYKPSKPQEIYEKIMNSLSSIHELKHIFK